MLPWKVLLMIEQHYSYATLSWKIKVLRRKREIGIGQIDISQTTPVVILPKSRKQAFNSDDFAFVNAKFSHTYHIIWNTTTKFEKNQLKNWQRITFTVQFKFSIKQRGIL